MQNETTKYKTQLRIIAAAFARDMAVRFSIPELINGDIFTAEKGSLMYSESTLYISVDAQPTGQMAALARKLKVVAVISKVPEIDNLYLGSLCFSYDHHKSGSNGQDIHFHIATENCLGSTDVTYIGAIEQGVYNIIKNQTALAGIRGGVIISNT